MPFRLLAFGIQLRLRLPQVLTAEVPVNFLDHRNQCSRHLRYGGDTLNLLIGSPQTADILQNVGSC